jgi:hypothetical protein
MRRKNISLKLVDKRIRPKHTYGVDWGVPAWIIAQMKSKVLLWQSGSSYYGRFSSTYNPAKLFIYDFEDHNFMTKDKKLKEGGRLSIDVLIEMAEAISASYKIDKDLLLENLLLAFKQKKTLLIGDDYNKFPWDTSEWEWENE